MKFVVTTLTATAAATLLLFGGTSAKAAPASPLVFSFSVTNTTGNVPGTFTGKIYGLSDNATGRASSVIIESFPDALNNVMPTPIDAALWSSQYQNTFTVASGQIVSGQFYSSSNNAGSQLFLNGLDGYNYLSLDGQNSKYVYGANGFANANFASVGGATAAAPEPGSIALALAAGVPIVGIVRRRKRHA